MVSDKNLVWLDLEMTGLRPEKDAILEIATIITDDQLNVIAQGPEYVIHQSAQTLALMDDVVKKMHEKSGLTDKVGVSLITQSLAERETLEFIAHYCKKGTAMLAGNSVCQDRAFLYQHMPSIVDFLHYRIIDITAIKQLVQLWYPTNPHNKFKKPDNHRALEDVQQSIEELKHYRKYFFIS